MTTIREILTPAVSELHKEFEAINVDEGGIGIMSPKSFLHVLRLRNVKTPAANILKQEMLSIGGECATSRNVILGDPDPADVLVMGTRKQLDRLAKKLKSQPFGLKRVSIGLQAFLDRVNQPAEYRPSPLQSFIAGDDDVPVIMGILNVTPDSFSDGGQYVDFEAAIAHGKRMVADGAQIIDIGGESTRPGSHPLPVEEEIGRVEEVISRLSDEIDVPISIDTMKADVAEAAIKAGAKMVNDISAGRHDPLMMELVSTYATPYVLMHMLGMPETMQVEPRYDNLMDDLHRFFDERMEACALAGVKEGQLILDPGIGFGKTMAHNYEILRRLRELETFGRPLLIGASRKSLLANKFGETPDQRLEESIAVGTIAMMNGVHILRVHDVKPAIKSRVVVQRSLITK